MFRIQRSPRFALVAALLLGAFGLRPLPAMVLYPHKWPVDRMLANVERYVERHPEAAEAHECLGRIHTYAFVFETAYLMPHSSFRSDVDAWERSLQAGGVTLDDLARLVAARRLQSPRDPALPPLDSPTLLGHLGAGLRELGRSLALAPERASTHLAFAYALERGAHLADRLDPSILGLPTDQEGSLYLESLVAALGEAEHAEEAFATLEEPQRLARALPILGRERSSSNALRQGGVARLLQRAWKDVAIEHDRIAFERAKALDLEQAMRKDFEDLVSLEAGEAYLRLTEGDEARRPGEEAFRTEVREAVERLRRLPLMSSITPIALALEGCRPLDDLVLPDACVLFDLDGDGVEEPWPWLRPDAGWLVWDPDRRGRITSGRQLLGDRSGWFLFGDGYHVLDALDDDGDGALRGAELDGLALWLDRDSDGVSDPGEVVPVADLGIAGLATAATERLGRSLANPCGVELADGRVLPSYDWVLEPLAGP